MVQSDKYFNSCNIYSNIRKSDENILLTLEPNETIILITQYILILCIEFSILHSCKIRGIYLITFPLLIFIYKSYPHHPDVPLQPCIEGYKAINEKRSYVKQYRCDRSLAIEPSPNGKIGNITYIITWYAIYQAVSIHVNSHDKYQTINLAGVVHFSITGSFRSLTDPIGENETRLVL